MTLTRIKQILDQHNIEWVEQDGAVAALAPVAHSLGEWEVFTWSTTTSEVYGWLGY